MGFKQRLMAALGEGRYRRLLVGGLRAACLYHRRELMNPAAPACHVLADESGDCWFGYYDVPATSPDGKLQLCLVVGDEGGPASLRVCGTDGSGMREIARTRAWCWQMGCRAQWLPDGSVLFNDFDGEGFVSRVVDARGAELRRHPFPVYALSRGHDLAFYPDFTILGHLRPGYGYTNLGGDFECHYDGSENGVWRGDITSDDARCLLTMRDIEQMDPPGEVLPGTSYINHISACPFADRIMFFHLWQDAGGNLRNHVVVTDYDGAPVNVLVDFDRASHYAWKDARHLLLTVVRGGACTYRLYDVETGSYDEFPHLSVDGHPSYVGGGLFLTDTYPDHLGMQHVMLCNERGVVAELAAVYHQPSKVGEHRCDCHPRYASGVLSFDTVEGARRTQRVMRLEFDEATVGALESASEESYDLVRIYKQLCNTREVLWPKLLFNRLTNTALKAHLCLYRYTSGRGGRLACARRAAVLQERYSIFAAPQTTIGRRLRMMHAMGICLGSGTVIGDDCVLYQQVTVGKGNGGFASLGNRVTVYAGAKVVGRLAVGDGAVVGANAVVTRDVGPGATVVGANRVLGGPDPNATRGGVLLVSGSTRGAAPLGRAA